jgi:hypothetical protein
MKFACNVAVASFALATMLTGPVPVTDIEPARAEETVVLEFDQ